MAYFISDEAKDLLGDLKKFCDAEVVEQAKEYDKSGEWPKDIYDKAIEQGYTTLEVPEEFGGPGLSRVDVAALIEQMAWADSGFATTISASGLGTKPVLIAGNEAQIKKRIGYSTGTISWYPRKRIRDIKSVMKLFYDTWDDAKYEGYLRTFALDEGKAPHELSEGMKVKCNLLFALSHGAEALILDEPTSGLDPFSRDELLGLFDQIKQTGVAVFFSTHIISDIERCADDIVYISKGRIVACVPKEEFADRYQRPGETLEESFLRLEGGMRDA